MLHIDQRILRNRQIAKICRRRNNINHAPSFHDDFPAIFKRGINDLLHAVYVGGKRGDNDSGISVFRKNIVKRPSNGSFRHGKSRPLRIGAVAHQRKHAFLSDFSQSRQINRVSKYRRIIHLEISGMHDDSSRGINGKRGCILNAVIRFDKFHPEVAKIDVLPVLYNLAFDLRQHIVLS